VLLGLPLPADSDCPAMSFRPIYSNMGLCASKKKTAEVVIPIIPVRHPSKSFVILLPLHGNPLYNRRKSEASVPTTPGTAPLRACLES
jgi:hypothetical protein